jgi:hypothetical protein
MGEVHRATDSRLGRAVALKLLPEAFVADRERLARFEREARLLASLNHPNIAHLYGFEAVTREDGITVHLIAMELVDGEDLAERMRRGALPVEEAIAIARQIADALEEAHGKGIVHRDLKPANVKLTADDVVKVLDFGLAKAWAGESAAAATADFSQSPTIANTGTVAGTILGTAAYMSPEQARGKSVDRRADIWAFGVVLFEMLTGRRLFTGESVNDILAGVLTKELDWNALPAATPPSVLRLLRRCLERNPKQRLRDIADARLELEEGVAAQPMAGIPAAPRRPWTVLAVALAASALTLVAAWLLRPPAGSKAPIRRIEFPVENLRANFWVGPLISPDGSRLAWIQGDTLQIRRLDDLETVAVDMARVAGQEVADSSIRAFLWSPDSVQLAFSTARKIWRVPAGGGAPSPICDIPDSGSMIGGDWGRDDVIVFSVWRGSLYRVPAGGGRPEVVLGVDAVKEVDFHRPRILPDGRGLLFNPHWRDQGYVSTEVIAGGKRRVSLKEKGFTFSHAVYAPGGFVVFDNEEEEGIWAVPFSLTTLGATAKPFRVVGDGTHPSISADGTMVYVRGAEAPASELVWVTRQGVVTGGLGPIARGLYSPALSPDGRQIAVSVWESNQLDLWLYDLVRGTRSRLTSTRFSERYAVWSPSGYSVLYVQGGMLRSISPAEGGAERTHATSKGMVFGTFSPDGTRIVYLTDEGGAIGRLWSAPADERLEQKGEAEPLTDASVAEGGARIAPQGDLVAYVATRAAQNEIVVHSFPSGGASWQVASGVVSSPRWSRNGEMLTFLSGDDLMEVEVHRKPSVSFGAPRRLFGLGERHLRVASEFDVAADGRFVMARSAGEPMTIVVAVNGQRLLEQRGKGTAP